MTLFEFVAEQKKRLDTFEAYWTQQWASNPNGYPMEMNSGDWDEQLGIFEEPAAEE